jgi:N-acetyl-anhydromuramyl-L-alanine amidase AmpD
MDEIKKIGNRFVLVDPNKFNNQYIGVKEEDLYNFSVPLEDLCISVELKTIKKGRTLLSTDGNQSTVINTDGNNITVNFIGGTKNETTGNERYLTTSYTDISSTADDIEEALGITNINIAFDSQYAPMVDIEFVDVRGAAIFQNEGRSKYNVFFNLPYPLFELTVKGFYGKPVKYCLHLTKFNAKFNSQSGNFEISTKFVGYTYALLSDMIFGYLRAIGETKEGKDLLAERGVESLNKFLEKTSKVDETIKKEISKADINELNDLKILQELETSYNDISELVNSCINEIKINDKNPITESSNNNIVIVPSSGAFGNTEIVNDGDNTNRITDFIKKINEIITVLNSKTGELEDLKITELKNVPILETKIIRINNTISPSAELTDDEKNEVIKLKESVKTQYNVTTDSEIDKILRIIFSASGKVVGNVITKWYDFTFINNLILDKKRLLEIQKREIKKQASLKLQEKLRKELNFDTSIRSIFKVLTTHVDIFLELLSNCSSKYNDNNRLNELSKFKQNLDINKNDQNIYPWPEYAENNVEKYLGSSLGPLSNPDNVPEIKFVNELYEGLIKNRTTDESIQNQTGSEINPWLATNVADSYYFNNTIVNPYDRLGDNPKPEDIARLTLLRLVTLLGYNYHIRPEELTNFASSESNLIIEKYGESNNIIPALKENYLTKDKILNLTGNLIATIDGTTEIPLNNIKIVKIENSEVVYDYIYGSDFIRNYGSGLKTNDTYNLNQIASPQRRIVPISGDFNKSKYAIYNQDNNVEPPSIFLSNKTYENSLDDQYLNKLQINSDGTIKEAPKDRAFYLSVVDKELYEKAGTTITDNIFNFTSLNSQINFNSSNFNIQNGRYKVQEFVKINYENKYALTDPIDFYTAFYDNGIGLTLPQTDAKLINTTYLLPNTANDSSPIKMPNLDAASPNETYTNLFKYWWGTQQPSDLEISTTSKQKDKLTNIKNIVDNTAFFPNFGFEIKEYSQSKNIAIAYRRFIPLFGSRFYYAQKTIEAKAFLFLHCFPWRGLSSDTEKEDIGIFKLDELIYNTFAYRNGFIQAPKLWSAFIGGLLWRYLQNDDPILFEIKVGDNSISLLRPFKRKGKKIGKNQYLKSKSTMASLAFYDGVVDSDTFVNIEKTILELPSAIKVFFLNAFTKFVGEYKNFVNIFELKWLQKTNRGNTIETNLNETTFLNLLLDIRSDIDSDNFTTLGKLTKHVKLSDNTKLTDAFDSFSVVKDKKLNATIDNEDKQFFNDSIFFTYKAGSKQSNKLIELLKGYEYIANANTFSWNNDHRSAENNPAIIKFSKNRFDSLVDQINQVLNDKVKSDNEKKLSNEELETLKFQIYRNCKAIYDKWIAGSENPNDIIFQCCKTAKDRLETDKGYSGKDQPLKLIDSFRFVDRAFKDIGDLSQINPIGLTQQVIDNSNLSLYQIISRILTDNNFNFIALPSFIDYTNEDDIKDMFEPIPYSRISDTINTGPSFVCVYVGQTSTKLDIPDDPHKNDSFDFTDPTTIPNDFTDDRTEKDNINAAFVVRYGQQNQNIFKNVTLDQSEFSETDESLQITDDIGKSGTSVKKRFIGQNLYSVYSVRSYSAEIEMMGNAQIQPMMYFQLENIPMFHGAHMITRVNHSIKPNYMSTTFKGTRIKSNATPIVDASTLYSSILDNYELGTSTEGSSVQNDGVVLTQYGGISKTSEPICGDYKVEIIQDHKKAKSAGSYSKNKPDFIVLHWTAGAKYHDAVGDLGYHYVIDENGKIHEQGPTNPDGTFMVTSHAGCKGKSVPCTSVNSRSIGISYVGGIEEGKSIINKKGEKQFLPYVRKANDWEQTNLSLGLGVYNAKQQFSSIVDAILLAKQKHPTINGITAHHLVSADKPDIGDAFPWDKLLDEVQKRTQNKCKKGWRPLLAVEWRDDQTGELIHKAKNIASQSNIAAFDAFANEINEQGDTNIGNKKIQINEIWDDLRAAGLSKNLSIGILANMKDESQYYSDAIGDKRNSIPWTDKKGKTWNPLKNSNGKIGCSVGLTQLNVCGGAGLDFIDYAKKKSWIVNDSDNSEKLNALTDYKKHIDYVIYTTKKLFPDYNKEKSYEQWTQDFAIKYERCEKCKSATDVKVIKRVEIARELVKQTFYTG